MGFNFAAIGKGLGGLVETAGSIYLKAEEIKSQPPVARSNSPDDFRQVQTGEGNNGETLVGVAGSSLISGVDNRWLLAGGGAVLLVGVVMLARAK